MIEKQDHVVGIVVTLIIFLCYYKLKVFNKKLEL